MLTQDTLNRITPILPPALTADAALLHAFQQYAYFARIPAGKDVFAVGDAVNAIALLVSGKIRVYKIGETGREITLYRFGAGESCILSANAILNNDGFAAIASVEQDAEAVMIPADQFKQWVDHHAAWREFVFKLLSQRLISVMELVDEVAFGRLDHRIIHLLLARTATAQPLTITHQAIASELGSSREVISRILGTFAARGWIELKRGTIEICDRDGLEAALLM